MRLKTKAKFQNFKIIYEFGAFHNNGEMLKLRPKELALLWLLISYANQLVTKEQIISEVWSGFSTSDESIARCISVIKAHLRLASPGSEKLIKTEYGRGYRFVGEVSFYEEQQGSDEEKKSISSPPTIGEIASRNILKCNQNATILEVANLLSIHQKSSIIVYDENEYVGIWTEADALSLDFNNLDVLGKRIGEFMKSPIISVGTETSISTAVKLMRDNSIRHLVIIDNIGDIYGVVSQSDIIHSHGVESFMVVKDVNSIAYKKPCVISKNLPISEIVRHMKENKTDILILHLENRPIFSFTEHDLINLISQNSINSLIGNIDLPNLVSIKEDTSILVARQLMDIKKIKHLAVLDKDGNFIKILSLSDILVDIENSYGQLIEEILEQNKNSPDIDEHIQLLARAMQQTAGMIIITDMHGDIEYVNESFEKCSGYKLNEIKGSNPRLLSSGIIPKKFYQDMWDTLKAGKPWKGEFCNKKKSGEQYWIFSSITPIYDGKNHIQNFIAVNEEISEKKAAERRLLEIEQRFNELAQNSSVMIWECDPNGKMIFLNQYWLDFTGCQLPDLIGNGWAELLHPEDLKAFLDVFQKALIKRSPFCIDHRIKNSFGKYKLILNFGDARFNKSGEFLGFKGTCFDITSFTYIDSDLCRFGSHIYKAKLA